MLRILTLTLLLFSLLPSWSAAADEKHIKHPVDAKATKAKSNTKLIKTNTVSKPKPSKTKTVKTKHKIKHPLVKQTTVHHNKTRHTHLVKQGKSKHSKKAAYAKSAHSVKMRHLAANRVIDEDEEDDDDDMNGVATSHAITFAKNQNAPSLINPVESRVVDTKTQELLDYAKGFLGTSYRFGGYSPATGFDCSGYVSYVYGHAAGIELPHNAFAISRFGARVPRANLRPGDLVFFEHRFRRAIGHVGIYMGNNRFIHASSSRTGYVEISDLRERYWTRKFEGGRRLIEG